jgi:hypothetical protein
VEHALPAGEHGNVHHNVPQIRGGSDESENLSPARVSRHNGFHRDVGGVMVPTELARTIALHSVGLIREGRSMGPEQLDNVFQITTMQEWNRLYDSRAVEPIVTPFAAVNALDAMEVTRTLLLQEIAWTRQTIDALLGERETFPVDEHLLYRNALRFFDASDAGGAIEGVLTERHRNELTWSKPLRRQTRHDLLRWAGHVETFSPDATGHFVHVLRKQEKHLADHEADIRRAKRKLLRALGLPAVISAEEDAA